MDLADIDEDAPLLDYVTSSLALLEGIRTVYERFGVMIPLAPLANQRWSSIAAAAVTIAVLVAVSFAALGGGVWHAFIDSMNFTQTVVLEQGGTGWEKIQSAFFAARNWGADDRPPMRSSSRLAWRSRQASPGSGTARPPSS